MFRRIAGFVLLLIGLLGVLLSIGGIIYSGRAVDAVVKVLNDTLGLTGQSLSTVEDTLTLARDTIGDVNNSLVTVEETADSLGHFKPNAFGLHDMHGNLSEWTQDCWHKSYDGAPTDGSSWTSPERGDTCNRRVIRGGSWFREAQDVRSASRNSMAPHIRSHEIGFRIARDLGE